ncbi:MAG: hypothetical protein GY855_12925 [candidate division Zixibacteria bacterium]|nr:hypothetical protein [candidate division Zixibacteria bacterium]
MKSYYLPLAVLMILTISIMNAGLATADKNAEVTTKSGTMVCLGCSMKSTSDAGSMCSKYGCESAFKTADGKIWHLLENDKSHDLKQTHASKGKEAKITGYFHKDSQTIDLVSYEVGDKKAAWCEGHGKMDGCSIAGKH